MTHQNIVLASKEEKDSKFAFLLPVNYLRF